MEIYFLIILGAEKPKIKIQSGSFLGETSVLATLAVSLHGTRQEEQEVAIFFSLS